MSGTIKDDAQCMENLVSCSLTEKALAEVTSARCVELPLKTALGLDSLRKEKEAARILYTDEEI